MVLFGRDWLEKEREQRDTEQLSSDSENYTIFHALVETMAKKKDEKDSRRRRFLRKLRLSK